MMISISDASDGGTHITRTITLLAESRSGTDFRPSFSIPSSASSNHSQRSSVMPAASGCFAAAATALLRNSSKGWRSAFSRLHKVVFLLGFIAVKCDSNSTNTMTCKEFSILQHLPTLHEFFTDSSNTGASVRLHCSFISPRQSCGQSQRHRFRRNSSRAPCQARFCLASLSWCDTWKHAATGQRFCTWRFSALVGKGKRNFES